MHCIYDRMKPVRRSCRTRIRHGVHLCLSVCLFCCCCCLFVCLFVFVGLSPSIDYFFVCVFAVAIDDILLLPFLFFSRSEREDVGAR